MKKWRSVLFGLYLLAGNVPAQVDVASLSIATKQLHIPALDVQGQGIFKVSMLLSKDNPVMFQLQDATLAPESPHFLATFSFGTGSLHIPLVEVSDETGGVQYYKAYLALVDGQAPLLFKLTNAVLLSSLPETRDTFALQILHSSDNESSFQDPNTLEPKILRYATIVKGLQMLAITEGIGSIYLTAGDHTLPGPFYEAAAEVQSLGAPGIGDIEIYNAMGLVANGIGNHEFDGGINDFARMLARADYPFIAVNLDFSKVELEEGVPPIQIGVDGGSVTENAGKVVKSAYVEVRGEKIGLIGRAPADFFNVINDPETTLPGLDFFGGRNSDNQPNISAVEQVLEQVTLLESQGINKIILLDHAQDFTSDPLSAQSLRGIDIIVAAGSTGFMAQAQANGPFNLLREGDTPSADYPTIREDSEGNTVLVVNSDQLYQYVGNLIVTFNNQGQIHAIDSRSGPVATIPEAISVLEAVVLNQSLTTPIEVENIFNNLTNTTLIQDQFQVIGTTTSVLNGERAEVRSRETNLGRLAADSSLWYAQQQFPDLQVDIALKNGGGIRDTILGPNVTKLTIGAALAFDNKLAIVELQGDELIAVMENSISRVPSLDGRFPQIAGMLLEYDENKEGISDQIRLDQTSRVKTLCITRVDGSTDILVENFQPQGELSRTFRLATNDFLLTGGDGYQALKAASEERGAVKSEVGERQVLIDYIQLNGQVDLPEPLSDPRIVKASSSIGLSCDR
jgi:2',3'-cyclic-nucleotide 2'-phosphodiesterase (5'-nucleotidase family)